MASKVWSNKVYVQAYQYALQGMTDNQIAEALRVGKRSLISWKKKRPTLRWAIEQGRGKRIKGEKRQNSFRKYVFNQLPAHLKKLWEKIERCQEEKNGYLQIQAMLEEGGKYAKMHLFMYALSVYNFNVSRACSAIGITLKEFNVWKDTEPDFLDLVNEMMFHKKNFFDDALVGAVSRGDTAAILFANKTLNKDRYQEPGTKVEVSGQIEHSHNHLHRTIDLDRLELPLEVRKLILQKHREYLAKNNLAPIAEPITSGGLLEYKRNGNKAVPIEDDE